MKVLTDTFNNLYIFCQIYVIFSRQVEIFKYFGRRYCRLNPLFH